MRIIFFLILIFFISNISYSDSESNIGVEFSSDALEVIENENIIIAIGNVEIKNKNRRILADKIRYDKIKDIGIATGNVRIYESDGSIFMSEKVILENDFKNITASLFYGTFSDKSKIKAERFIKKEKGISVFENGSYTSCNCDLKNGEIPIWELSTKSTKHDPNSKTIYHKSVVLKLLSVPILYLPSIKHPDWTVRKKSGFLTPTIGYSSQNKFQASIPYYYTTQDPTWDMTVTMHGKGENGIANQLNFRKKYYKSSLETNLYSGILNTNKKNNDDVIAFNYDFETMLKNKWKINSIGKYSDQDTFMRRYNFDSANEYKSFLKAENVSKNKISEIQFYKIQSLENNINSNTEPLMAPYISHYKFGNTKGFDYKVKLKAHEIKNDEYYDIQRWSSSAEIKKEFNFLNNKIEIDSGTGLDLYSINSRPSSDKNDNRYLERFSLGFALSASREHMIHSKSFDMFFEPKVQISSTYAPDRLESIPNRDSANYRIDSSNLFLLNQYQGVDNIQTNQKINYGFESLLLSDNLGELGFFIGQSQRIGGTEKGLINYYDRQSDFIADFNWQISEDFNANYNFLLDHHSLETNHSNLSLNGKFLNTNFTTNYRSIKDILVADGKDREEFGFGFNKSFGNWKIGYNNSYDLANDGNERISEEINIDYLTDYLFQDCLSINLKYKNEGGNSDRDISPENSIYLSIKLKNLGG